MRSIRLTVTAVTLVALTLSARAATIHVPADQPSIQDALDVAVSGDEVVVAPGTYFENLDMLGKTLTLRASDPDPALTEIHGGGYLNALVMISGEGPATLVEGFTFRNGGGGGGIFTDASATVRGCVFEDCQATTGAGIMSFGGDLVVEDCTFRNNHATAGGGISVQHGDVTIRRCDFADNEATVAGAIQQVGPGHVRIAKCRFRGNHANGSDAVVVTDATISNCLFRDHVGTNCILVSGQAEFANCTVVRNGARGILVTGGSSVIMTNCIVRGHSAGAFDDQGSTIVEYSNIEGGFVGPGNIDEPAGFVDVAGNDFHLTSSSPCVDAGDNGAVLGAKDLDQVRRVINDPDVVDTGMGTSELVDMGCYERLPPIRYVDVTAAGENTGHAWSDAFADLQDALDEASAGGVSEIWVAAGTYHPDRGSGDRAMSFEMMSGLEIVGGYAGNELERETNEPTINETVLGGAIGAAGTADNSHHVVTAMNVDGTGRLIGFIVQKGNAQDTLAHGGGIYIEDGAPVIRECIVRQNEANLGGAGIYSKDADTKIHRCRVNRNVNNSAVSGAGISLLRGEVLITNSFVFGNEGDGMGIGLYNVDADVQVVNSTIHGNTSVDNWNAGIFQPGGTLRLANSIVWGNRGDGGSLERQQIQDSGTSFTVDYSCVEGWTGIFDGIGSFGEDPVFVDAAGADGIVGTADDDVRLQPGSPAIDAGDNTALPGDVVVDLDADARYLDDPDTTDSGVGPAPVVDLGPYEFGTTCDADVNRDGQVDIQDLLAVLATWGPCGGCAEDIDASGAVDIGDLLAVLAAWGPCV